MTKQSTQNLKLYTEQPPAHIQATPPRLGSLPEVLRAFEQATGWTLDYVPKSIEEASGGRQNIPIPASESVEPGHLRLTSASHTADNRGTTSAHATRMMASALGGMLGELLDARYALWQREAELAAGVPLVPHADEQAHLAARLEAVLKGGAEAVDCHAAALYLLDDATTHLKLRSSWGLPFDRLTAPPRQLQGAIADLEALLGHAVVLENPTIARKWSLPEDFPAAVCVPVSTPTTLLGTLWVFSDKEREFNDRETNVIEVVAGRLAADLEREMLMIEGIDGARLKRQVVAAERLQRNQLPSVSPLLDGWELAGWTSQAETLGGDFHDWFCLPNGLLAVSVGDAMDRGIEAALAASAIKAALRAHAQYHRDAAQTLKQLNLTLWTGSAGDQFASMFLGLIETATGRVNYTSAGQPSALVVRSDGWESLSHESACLGEGPEAECDMFGYELQPGETLVLFTNGVRNATSKDGEWLSEAGVAEALLGQTKRTADELVGLVRNQIRAHSRNQQDDQTVLIVKRTPT